MSEGPYYKPFAKIIPFALVSDLCSNGIHMTSPLSHLSVPVNTGKSACQAWGMTVSAAAPIVKVLNTLTLASPIILEAMWPSGD